MINVDIVFVEDDSNKLILHTDQIGTLDKELNKSGLDWESNKQTARISAQAQIV